MKLGKLTEVDVRELWHHEQYDFSNWLAKDENIEMINEIIGLTLVDIDKEVYVGSYRCDLVANDETTGITTVEKTDNTDNAAQKVYNLNGQVVDNPGKGLYIVNGRKVVIR